MKRLIIFSSATFIMACVVLSCARPMHLTTNAAHSQEGEGSAPGEVSSEPSLRIDQRDRLIREQAALLKLYEARIKQLEEKLNGVGK
jgi:hypothetical protein